MADVKQIIAAAIEFEQFGHEYYSRFRELVKDEKARALMRSLAEDEKEHASILSKELAALGGRAKKPTKDDIAKGLSEIFPKGARKGSIALEDAVSALKLGIGTEERSIAYYSKNASKAGPKVRKVFEKLEAMERGHLNLLTENLRYLEDENSWFGYVPILEG